MDATRSPGPATAPWVMLLSIWPGKDAGTTLGWHARIVLPDACSREFDSPFELAQFLSRVRWPRADPGPDAGGLR